MNANSVCQPAPAAERYRTIDTLRGLALFGVLMVNLLTLFRMPLLEHILRLDTDAGPADQVIDALVSGALEFKAFTIFSFLFGVSIAMQVERAAHWTVSARTFLIRRLGWLFLLGAVHLFLIWNGDILALYAACGILLLPLPGLPWRALFIIGAAAIALPEFVSSGLRLPAGDAAMAAIDQARQVYGNGNYLEILRFRWHESWSLIVPLLIGILPRTLGLMLWGMAAWRSGVLRAPDRHRSKLAMGLALGTVLAAAGQWLGSQAVSSIAFALAYVCGLLLCSNTCILRLPGIAAAGQMALTNYLLQSVVFGFVFYGYGLGLFGRIGTAAAACIGVVLYAAEVQLSPVWLRRFRFGPVEWLWRSLTYRRRQPMLRRNESGSIMRVEIGGVM